MTFDMKLALESVAHLKEVIARACKIPEDKQVLLISGGESLEPSARVCNYSAAGTDTNPIYLFSKSTIENTSPPSPSVDYGSDLDLKEQVESSLLMAPALTTVVAHAQLAQQFYEAASDNLRICERLVHDQHMQQQGWAAVVANLEDITSAFGVRTEVFQQNFQAYLESRQKHIELLQDFGQDLATLEKIPLLPALMTTSDLSSQIKCRSLNEVSEDDPNLSRTPQEIAVGEHAEPHATQNLLQWISAKDSQSSLETVAEQCARGLEQFNQLMIEGLQGEIKSALDAVDNQNMKEVRGLEDRLCGLEQLMFDTKQIVAEQKQLAEAFMQHQIRAGSVNDPTVLPDLCASHQKPLKVMLRNHQHLSDIRRRCTRAKEELSTNLHARLRWIMYVERTMCDVDNKLVIYHENLKRLRRHLEVVQQIHLAPRVYLLSIAEVVRRKLFSRNFMQWAESISMAACALHDREVTLRREFSMQTSGHFLNSLFPGMEDLPPPFATSRPSLFDHNLPNVVSKDLDDLKAQLPEFVNLLDVNVESRTDMERTCRPCCMQSSSPVDLGSMRDDLEVGKAGGEGVTNGSVSEATLVALEPSGCPESSHDDREPESEPDTEEFEKVDDGGRSELAVTELPADQEKGMTREAIESYAEPEAGDVCTSKTGVSVLANESIRSPDSCGAASSQDFLTADFYIDESMPSSYTESNGTTGTRAGEFGHSVKGHHVIVAELQHRLEEKNTAISLLQDELMRTRRCCASFEERLRLHVFTERQLATSLRSEMDDMRTEVISNRDSFVQHLGHLANQLTNAVGQVQHEMADECELAVRHAVTLAQREHEAVVEEYKEQVDRVLCQLQNANSEIEAQCDLLRLKDEKQEEERQEWASELENVRHEWCSRLDDTVRKVTLEHELELEAVRDEMKISAEKTESEFAEVVKARREAEEKCWHLLNQRDSFEVGLRQKFQAEKEEVVRALEEGYAEREKAVAAKMLPEDSLRQELEQMRFELEFTQAAHVQDKKEALKELREQLNREHKSEMENLRARFRLAYSTTQSMERSPSDGSLEKIERPDVVELSRHEQLVSMLHKEREALLESERAKHQKELEELKSQWHREKQESLQEFRDKLIAEKQVNFNEAILKATLGKDALIEDLRKQNKALLEERNYDKCTIERLSKDNLTDSEKDSAIKSACQLESETRNRLRELETELSDLRSKYVESVRNVDMNTSSCAVSMMASTVAVPYEKVSELENIIKDKEEEMKLLQQRMMGLSMTASTSALTQLDKVAVLSCNIGDIVLLTYDERFENYIVFTIGYVLHFLHTDCLEALMLGPGESRKSWALAEITEKEYCQAKKAQNRYRVPLGTKFYRVRAKPWDKEGSIRRRRTTTPSISSGDPSTL